MASSPPIAATLFTCSVNHICFTCVCARAYVTYVDTLKWTKIHFVASILHFKALNRKNRKKESKSRRFQQDPSHARIQFNGSFVFTSKTQSSLTLFIACRSDNTLVTLCDRPFIFAISIAASGLRIAICSRNTHTQAHRNRGKNVEFVAMMKRVE